MLNEQDRDILRATLGDTTDPTTEQMKQAAAAINLARTLRDVEAYYQNIRDGQEYNALLRKDDYWPILKPLPEEPRTLLGKTRSHVLYAPRQRQHTAVPRDLLGAYCKKFKLDEAAMLRVLNGEQEEHQGYSRYNGPVFDRPGHVRPGRALGQPWRAPVVDLEDAKLTKEERRMNRRTIELEQPPTVPLAEEYTEPLAAEEFAG